MLQMYKVKDHLEKIGFHGAVTAKDKLVERAARNSAANELNNERNRGKLKRSQEDLKATEKLLGIDRMTGLLNSEAFHQRLSEEIAEVKRTHLPFTLLFIDMDKFKQVNDSYGHAEGDKLLKTVAKIFKKQIRQYDLLARLGGDEFAILLKNEGDLQQTQDIAQRIEDGFIELQDKHPKYRQVAASIGGVIYSGEADIDADKLLDWADDAMTQAKLEKRTALVMWHPGIKRVKLHSARH